MNFDSLLRQAFESATEPEVERDAKAARAAPKPAKELRELSAGKLEEFGAEDLQAARAEKPWRTASNPVDGSCWEQFGGEAFPGVGMQPSQTVGKASREDQSRSEPAPKAPEDPALLPRPSSGASRVQPLQPLQPRSSSKELPPRSPNLLQPLATSSSAPVLAQPSEASLDLKAMQRRKTPQLSPLPEPKPRAVLPAKLGVRRPPAPPPPSGLSVPAQARRDKLLADVAFFEKAGKAHRTQSSSPSPALRSTSVSSGSKLCPDFSWAHGRGVAWQTPRAEPSPGEVTARDPKETAKGPNEDSLESFKGILQKVTNAWDSPESAPPEESQLEEESDDEWSKDPSGFAALESSFENEPAQADGVPSSSAEPIPEVSEWPDLSDWPDDPFADQDSLKFYDTGVNELDF